MAKAENVSLYGENPSEISDELVSTYGYFGDGEEAPPSVLPDDTLKNSNYVEEGCDLLLEQFKKPLKTNPLPITRIKSLLTIYLNRVQDAENYFIDVIRKLRLPPYGTASGIQLDIIGNIIGRARAGMTDNAYINRLKSQAIINTASGNDNDVYRILQTVTDQFNVKETGNATVNVTVGITSFLLTIDQITMIRTGFVSGVTVNIFTKETTGLMFKLKDLNSADPTDGGTLYNLNTPNPSTAGKFVNII
jgi:hypothetical protein